MKAADAIMSINLKGTVDALTIDQDALDDLNNKAFGFAKMILVRLLSFVGKRVGDKKELYPGTYWHWESFKSKLSTMSLRFASSGHICDDLEVRGAHETYLQHESAAYLKFKEGLEKADGVYFFRDDKRGSIIRTGMSDNECKT